MTKTNDSQTATETPNETNTEPTTETQTETQTETTVENEYVGNTVEIPENNNPSDTTVYNENSNQINEPMAKKTETPAKETPAKEPSTNETPVKETPLTPTIKKDYTALVAALVAVLLLVGLFVWQNYRKRKEDENTQDLNIDFDGTEHNG